MATRSRVTWFWLAGAASALLFLQPETLGLKTAYANETAAFDVATVTIDNSLERAVAATVTTTDFLQHSTDTSAMVTGSPADG